MLVRAKQRTFHHAVRYAGDVFVIPDHVFSPDVHEEVDADELERERLEGEDNVRRREAAAAAPVIHPSTQAFTGALPTAGEPQEAAAPDQTAGDPAP